ncbi:MAG: DUF2441 domain-containing protein [Bacteroidales bacterium]|nr:DUF2441 domain-containing protein [Bacteroidales bacterium]
MKIENQTYYHFQRINEKNEHWKEGDIIEFNKSKENIYFSSLKKSISKYYNSISDQNIKIKIKSLEDTIKSETEKQIENSGLTYDNQLQIDSIKEQVDEIRNYYYKCIQLQQELIFETKRKKINDELPSRFNCIWVTKDLTEFCQWPEILKCRRSRILELKLTGYIHMTSGIFIDTDKNREISIAISNAEKYWRGSFNQETEIEYLFEGKTEIIKIL